jgi:hypothetical protein
MALIKRASKINVASIFENPVPGSNTIYLESEGYNETTLSPIFNAAMFMSYGQPQSFLFGSNLYRANNGLLNEFRSGDLSMTMLLSKEAASTNQNILTRATSGNDKQHNVSYWSRLSMDPTIVGSPLRRILDSSNNSIVVWNYRMDFYNYYRNIVWYNPTIQFHLTQPTSTWGSDGSTGGDELTLPVMPTIKDPSSNWVSMITQRIRFDNFASRPQFGIGRNNFYAYESVNQTTNTVERDGFIVQYVGQSSADNKPIYLFNAVSNDHTQYVTKHNVSANTTTDLHSFTATPTASGTNSGGARSTVSFQTQVKWSSKVFDDPTSSGNKCWYTPYFDTNLNFHPFFYQWNRTTDVVTRNSDITITGDLSTAHVTGLLNGTGTNSYMAGNVYNETFVNGGNRYLVMIPMNNAYGVYEGIPTARKIITYAVNASNPKALTHHSVVTVPSTIRNCVFLNDSRTILACIGSDALYIYTWTNATGWSLTSTIAEKFTAVGRDSTDRIWGTAARVDGQYAEIHMLTTTIPTRITISTDQSTYNYTGTNINGTASISAYNLSGERIAVSVALSISGSTMTFTGGASTTTVTTSASAEVTTPIVITGAGQSEIVATVSI